MRVCGLEDDGLVKRICGRHFKAEDFCPKPNQALLRPNAVPSLHLPTVGKEVNFEGAKIVTEDHLEEMFRSKEGTQLERIRLRYDCAVPECSPIKPSQDVSFHKLPALDTKGRPDPRRQLWIKACKIKDADKRGRLTVCSRHFREDDFNHVTKRLHSFAIPTLCLPNQQPIQEHEVSGNDPQHERLRYDCAVPGCPPAKHSDNVRFHRLPSFDSKGRPDPRRQLWIKACKIKNVNKRGKLAICSRHFREDDVNQESKRLHPYAIPLLCLPKDSDTTNEGSEKDPLDTSDMAVNKKVSLNPSNDSWGKAGVVKDTDTMDLEQIKEKLKKQFEEAKLAKLKQKNARRTVFINGGQEIGEIRQKVKRYMEEGKREFVIGDGTKASTFKCSKCPGHFRMKQELNVHFQRAHAQKYSCHICQMTFPLHSRLEMHLNAHSGTV